MVKIQHINPSNLDNAVSFFQKGGGTMLLGSGTKYTLGNRLLVGRFTNLFVLCTLGFLKNQNIDQVQSLLSKHPWHRREKILKLKNQVKN